MTTLPSAFAGRRRGGIAALIAIAALEAAGLFWLTFILRDLISGRAAPDAVAISLLITVGLGAALFGWCARLLGEWIGQDYVASLRQRLFGALVAGPASRRRQGRYGTIMARLGGDLVGIKNWVGPGLASLLVGVGNGLAGAIAVGLLLGQGGAAVAGGILLVALVLIVAFGPVARAALLRARQQRGLMSAQLGDLVLGGAAIEAFRLERRDARRLRRRNRKLISKVVRYTGWEAAALSLPVLVAPVALALVFAVDGRAISSLRAEPGGTAALIFSIGLVAGGLAQIARGLVLALEARVAMRRVTALVQMSAAGGPSTKGRPSVAAVPPQQTRIATIGVIGRDAADRNEVVAKVAERLGCGPSAQLRVAVAAPDVPLERGRLRRVVCPTKSRRRTDEISGLLRTLGTDDFAQALPDGFETWIDFAGTDLPPALAARLRLVRAVLAEADLILVDDPWLTGDPEGLRLLRAASESVACPLCAVMPANRGLQDFAARIVIHLAPQAGVPVELVS